MGEEAASNDAGSVPQTGRIATARAFVALVRDAALTLVLLVCLFHPSSIRWFLDQSNLDELEMFGVSIKANEAEDQVNSARGRLSAELAKLAREQPDAPPAEASRRPVDAVLSRALKLAERIAPEAVPTAGWVYLGHADAAMEHWQASEPVTTTATLPLHPEARITVSDDVYLRDVAAAPPYSAAPVTGIARVGDALDVVAVAGADDGKGGKYVWAKVALRKR
jgi:hypothetical protein